MSLIFDALQRSEGERSGADLSVLSAATELLQRVECETLSEWKTASRLELVDTADSTERNTLLPPPASPPSATEPSVVEGTSSSDGYPDIFAQFHSLKISIPPESRLVCLTDNEGLAAEKFRYLGVRLGQMRRERQLRTVLITSSIPQEGKSMVSANLACTLARKTQQRTLLVDGDLRRPSLSHIFGLGRMSGISEFLQGEQSLTSSIRHLEGTGLWILPAGTTSGNTLERMQAGTLTALMDQLITWFDWIIIDSPPVLPMADTSVWARLVDGILLVTRQGTTEKRQLQRGLEALDSKKLIGALINSSQNRAHSEYYYHYTSPAI
jgi:capsular exopolysaccharide synthesis family protein